MKNSICGLHYGPVWSKSEFPTNFKWEFNLKIWIFSRKMINTNRNCGEYYSNFACHSNRLWRIKLYAASHRFVSIPFWYVHVFLWVCADTSLPTCWNFLSDDKSGLSLCRSCGNQFTPYQLHPHTQTVTAIHLYLSHLVSICFLTLNRVS